MTRKSTLCVVAAVAALMLAPGLAQAEDAISHPAKKSIGSHSNEMVASLAVLNAMGASLDGNTLTLTGVSPNSIVFADRPVHAAGHVLTAHSLKNGMRAWRASPRARPMPPSRYSARKATA